MKATPGLFDLQVNGFAGVDFNDELITAQQLDSALEAMLKTGVTRCLPTLITASVPVLARRFSALDKAVTASRLGALMIPGYHLEGPFLNPAEGYAGCHPPQQMAAPVVELIEQLDGLIARPILLVTYAPEFDEGLAFVRALTRRGKRVAVGHSSIGHAGLTLAAEAGVSLSTHLGNGIPQALPKLDNTLQAQLGCDALCASFIADGLHIPPFALKNLLRAKTLERSILVTDAMSAAACDRLGVYPFAGVAVERVADGTVRVPGANNLAGSSLTLDQAIRNLVDWHIASFEQAIDMASINPTRYLQPALAHYRLTEPTSAVIWDEVNRVAACRIGNDLVRDYL
ncbi:N-acetylglucosamine-6-phosphate deacetylase [Biostraticola tofi]|uniref:N-acetylglucosamine 6-phosphate deacetylase n=1 Tax=Biostraticola tofi TaxID=466109 RepID=A0A4R3Z140_9GAMM|nr:amidohydrolase family protein [Biostraticola tofi]TCV98715.1 N-acetylglucosamine 6-phosphate deacetylase [Biostraticola tofi]